MTIWNLGILLIYWFLKLDIQKILLFSVHEKWISMVLKSIVCFKRKPVEPRFKNNKRIIMNMSEEINNSNCTLLRSCIWRIRREKGTEKSSHSHQMSGRHKLGYQMRYRYREKAGDLTNKNVCEFWKMINLLFYW